MVEDMMLSPMCILCGAPHPLTSYTTQMITDGHRCCMMICIYHHISAWCYMLRKATCAWNLDPRSVPALAAQPAKQLQFQESWKGPDWSMRRGHLQASWDIMSQTRTRSVQIDIWYQLILHTPISKPPKWSVLSFSQKEPLKSCISMVFQCFPWVWHEQLQDNVQSCTIIFLLQERNKMI